MGLLREAAEFELVFSVWYLQACSRICLPSSEFVLPSAWATFEELLF